MLALSNTRRKTCQSTSQRETAQPAFAYLKLTIETLEQGVKYV